MASAAVPILAGYLGSTLVSKIGESQGWDPRFTAIASILAGAGMGSVGAGVNAAAGLKAGAGAAMSTGQLAHSVYNPATMAAMTPKVAYNAAAHAGWALPTKQEAFTAGMKNSLSSTFKDKKFLTALGTTFIDGMFAEPEKKQALSGGGGGGGGGSAPAYQGGQGGQYQLLVGFPQKATGPQWKEVA